MDTHSNGTGLLILLGLYLGLLGAWATGLVIAFKANVILGVVYLIFPPLSLASGAVYFLGYNLPQAILNAL